jgi:hypothetical protein
MSDKEPRTAVRKPVPSDTIEERQEKKKKPYLNKSDVSFMVNYLGTVYVIDIPKGYTWDGATCLGLHHIPKFLNASMVHDVICEKKCLVAYDRQLSSMIFREICIASGVNKVFAYLAYYAIEAFQKTQNWKN